MVLNGVLCLGHDVEHGGNAPGEPEPITAEYRGQLTNHSSPEAGPGVHVPGALLQQLAQVAAHGAGLGGGVAGAGGGARLHSARYS